MRKISDIPDMFSMYDKASVAKPTLGGDPEFFVGDSKRSILAADKFFPGKHTPLVFDLYGRDPDTVGFDSHTGLNKLFFDGIQAEVNPIPSYCRDVVIANMRTCLQAAQRIIKDHKIIIKPSVEVKKSVIMEADPEARIFGCAPDFNAYTLTVNTPPMNAEKHPYRYSGGHMHFGLAFGSQKYTEAYKALLNTEIGHISAIRSMDYFVGLAMMLLDRSPAAVRRRSKYGKAGCFRPTPYGIEYRTLSCYWMKSPMLASLVYGLARLALNIRSLYSDEQMEQMYKFVGYNQDDVRHMIDASDLEAGKKAWNGIRLMLVHHGCCIENPINIRSFTESSGFIMNRDKVEEKNLAVHGLAALDYLIENGAEPFIEDVPNEWSLSNLDGFNKNNGFMTGAYTKFLKHTDFQKFQSSHLKEIGIIN